MGVLKNEYHEHSVSIYGIIEPEDIAYKDIIKTYSDGHVVASSYYHDDGMTVMKWTCRVKKD